MSRSRLQFVSILSCLCIAAGLPPEAAAQFGKLKKVLGDKAKGSACVPDRPPTYVETVSLTPARMAAINAGLEAEIQAAPTVYAEADRQEKETERRRKEYEKASTEYDKASQKYQACADKVRSDDAAKSEALNQKADAAGQQLEATTNSDDIEQLAHRAQAAAERVAAGTGTAEDRATLAEFQQKMAGVRSGSDAAMAAQQTSAQFDNQQSARVEQKCGKQPVAPAAPADAELPGGKIRSAGAKAAGLSDRDYAAGREDLLALAMSNAVVKGSGKGSSGKPSDEDAAAMNEQIKATASKVCAMNKANVPLF